MRSKTFEHDYRGSELAAIGAAFTATRRATAAATHPPPRAPGKAVCERVAKSQSSVEAGRLRDAKSHAQGTRGDNRHSWLSDPRVQNFDQIRGGTSWWGATSTPHEGAQEARHRKPRAPDARVTERARRANARPQS